MTKFLKPVMVNRGVQRPEDILVMYRGLWVSVPVMLSELQCHVHKGNRG